MDYKVEVNVQRKAKGKVRFRIRPFSFKVEVKGHTTLDKLLSILTEMAKGFCAQRGEEFVGLAINLRPIESTKINQRT